MLMFVGVNFSVMFTNFGHIHLVILIQSCYYSFFCQILPQFFCFFFLFSAFWHEKHWKSIFWTAFGVCSTQTLGETYNNPSIQTNPVCLALRKDYNCSVNLEIARDKSVFLKNFFYFGKKFTWSWMRWQINGHFFICCCFRYFSAIRLVFIRLWCILWAFKSFLAIGITATPCSGTFFTFSFCLLSHA